MLAGAMFVVLSTSFMVSFIRYYSAILLYKYCIITETISVIVGYTHIIYSGFVQIREI